MVAVGFEGGALPVGHDPPVRPSRTWVSIKEFPELPGADEQGANGLDRLDGGRPVAGYLTRDLPDNIPGAAQCLKHLLAIVGDCNYLHPS
jgi:hypothetical protein